MAIAVAAEAALYNLDPQTRHDWSLPMTSEVIYGLSATVVGPTQCTLFVSETAFPYSIPI